MFRWHATLLVGLSLKLIDIAGFSLAFGGLALLIPWAPFAFRANVNA